MRGQKFGIYFIVAIVTAFTHSSLAQDELLTSTQIANDSDIVRAVNDQRRVDYVEGGGLVVTKILPDDNRGLKHQKWLVRLSNGITMQAVYNSDMCPRVPVKAGDVIGMGGQFIWTKSGALLHWLHGDPKKRRPDGFVYVNGKYFCKDVAQTGAISM